MRLSNVVEWVIVFVGCFCLILGISSGIRYFLGIDELGERNKELKTYENKTISEAYQLNAGTTIFRFSDGSMLEVCNGAHCTRINGKGR